MHWSRSLFVIPAVCLLAQTPEPKTRTVPLNIPGVKVPPGAPQPSVTYSMEPAPPPPAPAPDKVLLTIGDEKITAAQLDAMIESLPPQVRDRARGAARRDFADYVVRVKALSQEARRRGLDKTPAFQSQAAFQTEALLAGMISQDLAKTTRIDDAAERAYYDQHKSEYERVNARHILIRFKGAPIPVRPGQADLSEEAALAKAQDLRKKLVGGADFATLAQAESDDTGSATRGGDLGSFGRGQMVPSFEDAAFKIPIGQVSEPVRSQFGYHLILVEKRENKSFDEMKTQIEDTMRPQLVQKSIEDLAKAVKVTYDPEYYPEKKPAPAPQPK